MGFSYELGRGVNKDFGKAFELYQKAADKGDKKAPELIKKLKKQMNKAKNDSITK